MTDTFTAHNIRLDDGTETFPSAGWTIDQSTVLHSVRRVLELLWPQGLQGRSIVDLGCLEGGYAVEFARLGMNATGIEVRESNYRNCLFVKSKTSLPNLNFVNDDVNNIARHGNFDVFFINGLLYHLDRPRHFLEQVANQCGRALFLQTHVASAIVTEAIHIHSLSELTENEGLPGRWYPEHSELPVDELERMKWHSWQNTRSFWPQKEYLIQLVRDIGFDIVFEQFDFMTNIAQEMTSGFYHTNDRVLLVGIKSLPRPNSSD
jgi:SAM-dependent methyltransferase